MIFFFNILSDALPVVKGHVRLIVQSIWKSQFGFIQWNCVSLPD